MFALIENGKFVGFTDSITQNAEYIELTDDEHRNLYNEYCETPSASIELKDGQLFIGRNGDITPPSAIKENLINKADSIIQPLMGYALSGILSNDDKARFKAWNEYRKALEDVSVTATDIKWPAKPE